MPRNKRKSSMTPLVTIPTVEKKPDDNGKDAASMWISRFMYVDDRSIYTMFMEPYAGPDGSYDIANHMIESMYNRFIKSGLWDGMKFIRVTLWVLESKLDINQYTYGRGSRMYDKGTLPYGKAGDISGKTLNYIIGE